MAENSLIDVVAETDKNTGQVNEPIPYHQTPQYPSRVSSKDTNETPATQYPSTFLSPRLHLHCSRIGSRHSRWMRLIPPAF